MEGKLYIKSTGATSEVEIEGTFEDILLNWTCLTNAISEKLHVPPDDLAAALPNLLYDYKKALITRTEIDLAAMQGQQEGGGQP